MSVTIPTKDVGEVRDKIIIPDYKVTLESLNERYIKSELKIR